MEGQTWLDYLPRWITFLGIVQYDAMPKSWSQASNTTKEQLFACYWPPKLTEITYTHSTLLLHIHTSHPINDNTRTAKEASKQASSAWVRRPGDNTFRGWWRLRSRPRVYRRITSRRLHLVTCLYTSLRLSGWNHKRLLMIALKISLPTCLHAYTHRAAGFNKRSAKKPKRYNKNYIPISFPL